MIKIDLYKDDALKLGANVKYRDTDVLFNWVDDYTGEYFSELVGVTGVVGNIISFNEDVALCKVEFSDTSFLPVGLQHTNIWFVRKTLLEVI
jgi:hypothetical protein